MIDRYTKVVLTIIAVSCSAKAENSIHCYIGPLSVAGYWILRLRLDI